MDSHPYDIVCHDTTHHDNSNINVGFKIVTCVLIDYGKSKLQLLSNGFNMLKVDGSTHVPCCSWRNVKKSLTHSLESIWKSTTEFATHL
jgi:hypothetical protein